MQSPRVVDVVSPSVASGLSISNLLSVYTTWKDYQIRSEEAEKADRIRSRAYAVQQEQLASDNRRNQQNFELAIRSQRAQEAIASRQADNERYRIDVELRRAKLAAKRGKTAAFSGIIQEGIKAYAAYATGGASTTVYN